MQKRLIVNADDYGQALGINVGIIEAHLKGIVTSTTIMAAGQALKDGVARLKDAPKLGLGCHLVLIGETPICKPSEIASLVDSQGAFPRTLTSFMFNMLSGRAKYRQIVQEFRAQLDRLFDLGLPITHCDSHKHSHAHPMVLEAVLEVAEAYKIRYIRNPFEQCGLAQLRAIYDNRPAFGQKYLLTKLLSYYGAIFRQRMRQTQIAYPTQFQGFMATGRLSPELLIKLLSQLSTGINELMCHPARLDAQLQAAATRLKASREQELAALIDPQVQVAITQQAIKLVSFRDLTQDLTPI